MSIRLVDARWADELDSAIRGTANNLRLICPFIKSGAIGRLLEHQPQGVKTLTRFNLSDFAAGVSDIHALRKLLFSGATIRGIRNLHAKVYIFGDSRAIVGSTNLTAAALDRNHEFGLVATDSAVIAACQSYFDKLWHRAGVNLSHEMLDDWETTVTRVRAAGGPNNNSNHGLPDFGADAGFDTPPPPTLPPAVADASRAFVKFLGEGDNRELPSWPTLHEVKRSGAHWAVAWPASKRPRIVPEDSVIFIARLIREPNDIRIFGRAIGMKHVPERDDATPAEIIMRPWKELWPRYIRVHHAEFVAGTMANGISLNQLMDTLGANAFRSTQSNLRKRQGNTDPRRAYQQQAAVELSQEALRMLREQFQNAIDRYGKIPQSELDKLDWPAIPVGVHVVPS